ncbi:MAG: efflux RND transporter periplasmic adaptor subunit [Pirellulaceae bacterium]
MKTTLCAGEFTGAAVCHVGSDHMSAESTGLDFARLYQPLLDAGDAASYRELLRQLAPVVASVKTSLVVACACPPDGGESAVLFDTLWGQVDSLSNVGKRAVVSIARQVAAGQKIEIRTELADSPACLVALAVPGRAGDCLVAAFDDEASLSQTALLTLQAVTAQIGAWQVARDAGVNEAAALRVAALIELLGRIETTRTPREACRLLADELQIYLGCQQVVIGLCRRGSSTCRVEAMSHVDAFHPNSEETRSAQAALQEAIARGDLSLWPAPNDESRFGLKAHEQYASSRRAEVVVGCPLRDERGEVQGAWLMAGVPAALCRDDVLSLLRAAQVPVASALQLLVRAQPGRTRRLLSGLSDWIRQRRGQAIIVAVAIAGAAMCVPVPHRVACDCQLEPVTRRFIAAPFEGPLQETFVRPGDLVTRGQLLARMDGREIRWELSGVQADLYRAAKQRAGHVASHEAGEAEVARHEVDRLQFREQLLQARDQELEIRSPVDGMIVSGDLKDAEGMPLKVGEVLFEVAPLDAMIVELAIPEDDVTYTCENMPVRINFDAFPLHAYRAHVERIHPRAELRDEQNVFIGDVRLENPRQALHPGMRGHARIRAGTARLGWILFHRPLVAALQWLGW